MAKSGLNGSRPVHSCLFFHPSARYPFVLLFAAKLSRIRGRTPHLLLNVIEPMISTPGKQEIPKTRKRSERFCSIISKTGKSLTSKKSAGRAGNHMEYCSRRKLNLELFTSFLYTSERLLGQSLSKEPNDALREMMDKMDTRTKGDT